MGDWIHHYRYGVEESYEVGMKWLAPCATVEDWGCGPAYSKRYRKGTYLGLDGTAGFCDRVVDLRTYRSSVPGIFMRHVLEHNHDWKQIIEGALASFTERMSLIFFTPWQSETHVIHMTGDTDIPVIGFRKQDILDYIAPYIEHERVIHRTDKKLYDTVFCLKKNTNYGETHGLRPSGAA